VAEVDGRQIEQVFLNLLLNACQAVGGKGRVGLQTAESAQSVEVTIRDTGPGIPAERMEQIFRPFFTTRAQGTGLGLAICKRIVEAHHGRIDVSSPPDGGARFTVVLPEAGAEVLMERKRPGSDRRGRAAAQDDPEESGSSARGYDVREAETGAGRSVRSKRRGPTCCCSTIGSRT
jgi:hypothetical protein